MAKRSKETAKKLADELVAKLGDGWKAHVWWSSTNWDYCAKLGSMMVYQRFDGKYYALIDADIKNPGGGFYDWTVNYREGFNDCHDAVRQALKDAADYTAELMKVIRINNDFCASSNIGYVTGARLS